MLVDINECAEGISNCAQLCTDTDGSYFCSCIAGYLLREDSQGCSGMSYFLYSINICLQVNIVN